MREKKRAPGRPAAPASKTALFAGVALLLGVAAFFALRDGKSEEPAAAPPKVAALAATPPSDAFRRANWTAPPPKEEPTDRESFFARKEEPRPAPGALAHLNGVEIVFPVPEETR